MSIDYDNAVILCKYIYTVKEFKDNFVNKVLSVYYNKDDSKKDDIVYVLEKEQKHNLIIFENN